MLQTAYGSMFNALRMKKGESLLVRGGSTSVGLAAAVIAKYYGITVSSTTRNPKREDLSKKSGASTVILDNGFIAQEVKRKTDGGMNKVLELVDTTTLRDSLQCVKPHGVVCMTSIVGNSRMLDDYSPMEAIPPSMGLTVCDGGPKAFISTPLQQMVVQIEAGTLSSSIGKPFKLDDIVEAHATMEENKACGKVVVLP